MKEYKSIRKDWKKEPEHLDVENREVYAYNKHMNKCSYVFVERDGPYRDEMESDPG